MGGIITIIWSLMSCMSLAEHRGDEIMQKHIKAMSQNWDKTKTLKLQGHIYQQGVESDLTIVLTDHGDYTINTYGGYTNTWAMMPQGNWVALHETGAAKVDTIPAYNALFYFPYADITSSQLLNYKSKGWEAHYDGTETFHQVVCHKVILTNAKKKNLTAYIDKATYYLVHMEGIQETDDRDKDLFVTYEKYEQHGNVIVPMVCMNQNNGVAATKETNFSKAEINVPFDESLFVLTPSPRK